MDGMLQIEPRARGGRELIVTAQTWSDVGIREAVEREAGSGDGGDLQELDLTGCLQTAPPLVLFVAPLVPRLRTLNLWGCVQLDDPPICALAAHCPRLRELTLAGLDLITDASVLAFAASCEWLTMVDLSGCPQVPCRNTVIRSAALGPGALIAQPHSPPTAPRAQVTSGAVRELLGRNPRLLRLTPGFLRAIPQHEEDERRAEVALRDQGEHRALGC